MLIGLLYVAGRYNEAAKQPLLLTVSIYTGFLWSLFYLPQSTLDLFAFLYRVMSTVPFLFTMSNITRGVLPLWGNDAFPSVSDFPRVSEKILTFRWKFSRFYLFPKTVFDFHPPKYLTTVADPGGKSGHGHPIEVVNGVGPPLWGRKSNDSIVNLSKCRDFGPPRIDVGYGFGPPTEK